MEITKTTLNSLEIVYEEAHKFVHLEREMEKNPSIEKYHKVIKENKETKSFIQNNEKTYQAIFYLKETKGKTYGHVGRSFLPF